MNKGLLKSVLVICAIFGVSVVLGIGQAQATLINDGGISDPDNDSAAYFSDLAVEPIILLDKDEFNDGTAVGDISDEWLHVTYYDDDPLQEATVWWDLTGTGLEARYVAVKDGNANGTGLFWVQYTVLADQYVVGGGDVATWSNGAGNISHISLYGTRGTSVPDASVMLLLGSSLIVLGLFGRRKTQE